MRLGAGIGSGQNTTSPVLHGRRSGGDVGRLLRPQRELDPVEWPGGGVEHHPGHGVWIRWLRTAGFVVDALHELYASAGADAPGYLGRADVQRLRRELGDDVVAEVH